MTTTTALPDPPSCTGGSAPERCQPEPCRCPPPHPGAMSRRERADRLKAELDARRPYACHHCGSGALRPWLPTRVLHWNCKDCGGEVTRFATDRRRTWICVACSREFCESD